LFPTIKIQFKGPRVVDIAETEAESQMVLDSTVKRGAAEMLPAATEALGYSERDTTDL
jgi:hypothetical protein